MEHKTTIKSFAENKIELFNAVKIGNCSAASGLIKTDPNLANASVVISGSDKPVPLLNYLLYCAKRGPGEGNETIEGELISLAKLVLSYDTCNILNKTPQGDTALHTAIWYSYLEIAEIIIAKAEKQGCVKALCTIKNDGYKETPMYVLIRKLNSEKTTTEERLNLEKIRTLLLDAQQQEHDRKIAQKIAQESFATTADEALKEFYEDLEELLEDPISYMRIKKPIILPEGQTLGEDYFTDPLLPSDKKNINPITRSIFYENAKVPHVLIQKLIDSCQEPLADTAFYSIEDLLCCPLTKQPLTDPCVIAEKGKVFKDGLDLYGYTCNKAAIELKGVKTYPALSIPNIVALKQKYNKKLKKLENSAKEKAKQTVVASSEMTKTLTSNTEEHIPVYIEDMVIPNKPFYTFKRTFKVYDSPERMKKLEEEIMKVFISREDVVYVNAIDDALCIMPEGKETIRKVTDFFIDKKMLTLDEIKQQCALEAGISATVLVSSRIEANNEVTKIYQIFSTSLYITQMAREMMCMKTYREKQGWGTLVFPENPGDTEIKIEATGSKLIKTLESFLRDGKKLTLEEVEQEAKVKEPSPNNIATQPKSVKPDMSQSIPAAVPSVFSPQKPVSNPASSPQNTFPKPIKISIDSSRITLGYTRETIGPIVEAIKQQLQNFHKINLAQDKNEIYIYFKESNATPWGARLIQEDQTEKVYIKFRDEGTKNHFINIFNMDSPYMTALWYEPAIEIGLGFFGEKEKPQPSSNCSIM